MLKNYKDLLSQLLENVLKGDSNASFWDCIETAGMGVLLMLILSLLVLIILGFFWVPLKGYGIFTKKEKAQLLSLIEEGANGLDIQKVEEKLQKKKILFGILFAIFYVPVCIPMALYIVSLLLG